MQLSCLLFVFYDEKNQLQKCQQKRKVEQKDKKKTRTQKRLNNNIDVATSTSTLAIDKIYFSRQKKCISWMRSYNFSLCIKITLKRKKYTTDCVSERSCSCSWLAINREASIKMEITVNAKCCCCLHEYAQEHMHIHLYVCIYINRHEIKEKIKNLAHACLGATVR